MDRSEAINELVAALTKAQAAMTNVNKGSRAKIATKTGGEYSYTYADLGDIYEMLRKPLADNGLAIMQVPSVNHDHVDVETILAHTSGQWIGCTVSVGAMTADPKAIGSAITYARRYGMALIGVVTDDDDDGSEASKSVQRKTVPTKPVDTPQPTNGAAIATEQKTHHTMPPRAAIKTVKFGPRMRELHAKLMSAGIAKYATKDGGIDFDHAQMSAAAEKFESITDDNLDAVMAAIERRATTPVAQ